MRPDDHDVGADEYGAALDVIADLRDSLDRALVASESARAAKHACANMCQRLVAVGDVAVRELVAAGANDAAARIQEMIRVALEK